MITGLALNQSDKTECNTKVDFLSDNYWMQGILHIGPIPSK